MIVSGATVIVTGGASGLGLAAARRFAELGANVAIFDIVKGPGEFRSYTLDVCDEDAVTAALDDLSNIFSGPSILLNAAGKAADFKRTYGKNGPFSLDIFRKIIEVNLIGTFNCARLAAERMAKNMPQARAERGVIINVSSINAFDSPRGTVAYSAAKAGVVGMTLAMARDLASAGIRVCTIAPGSFDTPMLVSAFNGDPSPLLENIPFPNDSLGSGAEFANLAVAICENAMLNGETIRIDGAARLS
ncbi:SDR family NAD(P)-dependent oxidoreductase [Pacificimonas sp. WHA3]|uniref:SDR family NAD(P)-dependent oxidoreductase n=1 Tax=Pacificimonas pallii TaxID=2827236 RepID=A0ABS6SAB0_9SPHN|nr:SDR family NAD(P)-dependent oxidoreductase [Pacificimonas pallii]MBV7255323.1 SDR family NAD(P)-dependent oxidoreductase [Pacificimonas pallii]